MDKSLPTACAAKHPDTRELIFIRKGDSDYYAPAIIGIVDETLTPGKWNKAHNISKGEMVAMIAGTLFGWESQAAYAENYHADGRPNTNWKLND